MKQSFNNATLRLTSWYLLILAIISLLFSLLVYQLAIGEIERRIDHYHSASWPLVQITPYETAFDSLRSSELDRSKGKIIGVLVYVNLVVVSVGGGMSYILARRTLRPIAEAHEAQSRFVSDASHELRTPLAAMQTELEVSLSDPSLKKPEMHQLLASNLEEVKRLSSLTGMLLVLSSGRPENLSQKPFDLTTSIKDIVSRLGKQKKRLKLDLPKQDYRAIGNQPAIEELISILVDNALKYSPENSQVTVKVELLQRERQLRLRVHNSGKPIDEAHLGRIFERFYRADSSRTGHKGYGLGLSLARQISQFHKTDLVVTSTQKKGTEFSFKLPTTGRNKVAAKPKQKTAKKSR